MDQSFRRLLLQSAVVFAVSEGMARTIGPHRNLQWLPPIPDPSLQPCPRRQRRDGPWQMYYSGLCGGLYSPLLKQLTKAVGEDQRFALHCSGTDAKTLEIPAGHPRVRSSGFLDGEAWQQAFNQADVLVLVLSFEPRHRRHLATHFPSKLVEYANRRRPFLIWGPPWSSAIQWGYFQPHALYLTNSSAEQMLSALDQWLEGQPADTPTILGLHAPPRLEINSIGPCPSFISPQSPSSRD